ncbi:MAG: MurR/RpiR family transcriptional regulator [Gammaproteobacteria bacterium]
MTTKEFQNTLKKRWIAFTPSEQRIATHLLNNINAIPFETAASLGKIVGVSPMTVSRFLRSLGYEGLGDLKEELRHDAPWLKLYKTRDLQKGSDSVAQSLQTEIKALTSVYELAKTPEWKSIVARITHADRVGVASFQLARFIGFGFATLLQNVKPNTIFADGADGAYTDLLLDSGANSCLILIEFRRYSRHFRILAEESFARKIPLIIITDTQCHWARQMTSDVLMLPIDTERAWHSHGSVFSLLSLLLEQIILELGDVYGRIEDIAELRHKLIGYTRPATTTREKRDSPTLAKDKTAAIGKQSRGRRHRLV